MPPTPTSPRTSPRGPPASRTARSLLLAARKLAATRQRDADFAYGGADELLADLRVVQDSLATAGARRQAYGELQHLIWQVETFGFHLAELEVRQHSKVHARALAELRGLAEGGELSAETEEVLAVFRVMARIQQRFGADACRRYVVSFTQSADDLAAVHELAARALDGRPLALDVVPLFETERRPRAAPSASSTRPSRRNPCSSGSRRPAGACEVMLGYSDSAKDAGPLSATLALYDAQAAIAAWADRHVDPADAVPRPGRRARPRRRPGQPGRAGAGSGFGRAGGSS